MDLKRWIKDAHKLSKEKGFWDDFNGTHVSHLEKLLLINSEITEALEELREGSNIIDAGVDSTVFKSDPFSIYYKKVSNYPASPECIAIEMADIALRCLDYLGHLVGNNTDMLNDLIMAIDADTHNNSTDFVYDMDDRSNIVWLLSKISAVIFRLINFLVIDGHNPFDVYNYDNKDNIESDIWEFLTVIKMINNYFKQKGQDLEFYIKTKYDYNMDRSRLHGKVF